MSEAKLEKIKQLLTDIEKQIVDSRRILRGEGQTSGSMLPKCIGYHEHPMSLNGPCNICPYEELCKSVIAKKRLEPIVDKILEVKATLKGEEVK